MCQSTEYPKYTSIPETPCRIKEDVESVDEPADWFYVCLEYNVDTDWLNVACVHHDVRIHKRSPDIFTDGFYLQYYKDGKRYRRAPVEFDNDLDGRPIKECMMLAHQVLAKRLPHIIPRFEEWHGIRDN